MAKIDEIKEHINTLRNYLNILTVIILAVGVGVAKLYINDETGLLFWIGIIFCLIFILIFALISKSIHDDIKKLKDL